MRTALFGDKEREMAKHYLETGEKGKGFHVLVHRCRRSHTQIKEDLALMDRLLERLTSNVGLENVRKRERSKVE